MFLDILQGGVFALIVGRVWARGVHNSEMSREENNNRACFTFCACVVCVQLKIIIIKKRMCPIHMV